MNTDISLSMLVGIKNLLSFINDNWTLIIVIFGLCLAIYKKIASYLALSTDEKIEIAKYQIHESMLKLITNAEEDYDSWIKAGEIKRSQVIKEIFKEYPVLSRVTNQDDLIEWIDNEIKDALKVLRNIIQENNTEEESK